MSTAAMPPVDSAMPPDDAAMPPVETASAAPAQEIADEALVRAPQSAKAEGTIPLNARAMRLPVELEVAIPLRDFRVRNLLSLQAGTLVESRWMHGDDVPIGSADVQLAWSEIDVLDTQLAVRLTRLV
jgi:flagellar motor switch/type III secretory pathway protein FliN